MLIDEEYKFEGGGSAFGRLLGQRRSTEKEPADGLSTTTPLLQDKQLTDESDLTLHGDKSKAINPEDEDPSRQEEREKKQA